MPLFDAYPQIQALRNLARSRKRRIYVVGGYLRDHRLGKESFDFDFAVSAEAIKLARIFSRRIKGAFVLLDDTHGSARVVKRQGSVIYTFDLTDLRGKDIAADLELRDFTINTFCLDLSDEKECSLPFAAKDLKLKTIRMVSQKAFDDDPLRLLRAFSLAAQTGFKIEPKTLARIKTKVHLINTPAMERVREEFFKVLHSPRAHQTIDAMDKIGMLERIIPQIAVMFGVHQGGFHHLDVWKHSKEVLRQLEELFVELKGQAHISPYLEEEIGGGHTRADLLKLAALLHDIGKPETRKKEKTRMTFHGHEHVGQKITRLIAKRLKLSVKERHWVEDAVRMHLRPGYLANFKKPTPKAVFRYLRDTKAEAVSIAILAMADQRATRGRLSTKSNEAHHAKICRMIIDEYFKEKTKPVLKRLITGHDLIKGFKLEPSPLFTKILTTVEEAHALGKITSKKEAMALARQTISGHDQ